MILDLLTGLNKNQVAAVTHVGTPLLILAGAGAGKTRVLTHRAMWLIQQQSLRPGQVLMLTFTNKAAGEMKERMRQLLGEEVAGIQAGTFHSFGCQILRKWGKSLGINPDFSIFDQGDSETLIRGIILEAGFTTREFRPASVMGFIDQAKNNIWDLEYLTRRAGGFWEEQMVKFYSEYQKRLFKYGALDFGDLIYQVVRLMQTDDLARKRIADGYKQILIDEYQDTNLCQYELTKLLVGKSNGVTVVGDAAQSIYGWRGASFQNLMSFKKDFAHAVEIHLEQNYRSTPTILEAANSVIIKSTDHPVLKLLATQKDAGKIGHYVAKSEIDEAEFVAEEIKRNTTKTPFREIAVLYRINAQSRVLEESFIKHRIPYVLVGGVRFYERAEVKDVIAMVRWWQNPADLVSAERAEKALGKRRRDIWKQSWNDKDKFKSADLIEWILKSSGYLERFDPKDEEDQRRLENVKELISVASEFPKLNDFLENIALVQQEYSQSEKSKKKEAKEGVRLMTLHAAKGLEFEKVFLVGMEEGLLPHSRSLTEESDIGEERRLCYVGITRAKKKLYLTYATRRLLIGRTSLCQPSRFLSDIPPDLIEELGMAAKTVESDDRLIYDPLVY